MQYAFLTHKYTQTSTHIDLVWHEESNAALSLLHTAWTIYNVLPHWIIDEVCFLFLYTFLQFCEKFSHITNDPLRALPRYKQGMLLYHDNRHTHAHIWCNSPAVAMTYWAYRGTGNGGIMSCWDCRELECIAEYWKKKFSYLDLLLRWLHSRGKSWQRMESRVMVYSWEKVSGLCRSG